jgi:hypothetical protein
MGRNQAVRDTLVDWGTRYVSGIQRRRAKRLAEDAEEYANPEARRLVLDAARLVRKAGELEGWEQE